VNALFQTFDSVLQMVAVNKLALKKDGLAATLWYYLSKTNNRYLG